MKKVLSLVIIAVMLVAGTFLLTGCGNEETNNTQLSGGGTGGSNQGENSGKESGKQGENNNDDFTTLSDRLIMKLDYGDGDSLTSTYYFKNGKCEGKTGAYINNSVEIAQSRYETYLEHPYYEDVKLEGVTITFKYTEDGVVGLKGKDKQTVKDAESAMGAVEVND